MKYHFIGNQGISMSAISELLESLGHEVSGSDLKSGGHDAKNISSDIDVVVRTSAVNLGSPGWVEVEAAQKKGIPVIKRSELLGRITDEYFLIAISGMHGKTTTSSMVGLALIEAGLDPTVLIGEKIPEFGDKALKKGESKYFVMEACEYDRSFLDFRPNILLLTNIDEEHLDTYPGGLEEIKDTFRQYFSNIRKGGTIIANYEDEHLREILGSQNADYKIIWYGKGSQKYSDFPYDLTLSGSHNQLNAKAVLALCDEMGVDTNACRKVFSTFKGAKRRLEYWGEFNKALLYDDYGHHPTEISATINALKEKYPEKNLYVVFWPHQYKRVKSLIKGFSKAFGGSKKVFVKEIFFVPGRDEISNVSSGQLAAMISRQGIDAVAFLANRDILDELKELSLEDCVILTIGIPPIYKLLDELIGA